MYRSDRFFNKKRFGQHNYYGEEEELETNGRRINNDFKEQDFETPSELVESESEKDSG